MTDAAGGLHTLAYSSHLLTADAQGFAGVTYAYSNGLAAGTWVGTDGREYHHAGNGRRLGAAAVAVDGHAGGTVVNGLGQTSQGWYNVFGQVVRTQAADGGVEAFARDGNGWVTGYVDPCSGERPTWSTRGGEVLTETRPTACPAPRLTTRTAWGAGKVGPGRTGLPGQLVGKSRPTTPTGAC